MNQATSRLGLTAGALLTATWASATLFIDDFDVDSSAAWNVNNTLNTPNNIATFAADYSIYNIPSAPGSSGGSTKGLILEANIAGSIFSGLTVSPKNVGISGDFTMTADVWMNFVGPGPGGGSGSTQFGAIGFGTSGTSNQWIGSATRDCVYFGTTTDGNSASDYRAYSSAAPTSYPSGSSVYNAPGGGINNSNAYYTAAFPSVALPGVQNGFATQTGTTLAGSTGFKWRKWTITKVGTIVTYSIDSLLISTIDTTGLTFGGDRLLIGFNDINATSTSTTSRLNFMLVDNLQVVPEPASVVAMAMGAAGILIRRRRKS